VALEQVAMQEQLGMLVVQNNPALPLEVVVLVDMRVPVAQVAVAAAVVVVQDQVAQAAAALVLLVVQAAAAVVV
jgi:hypothetical protein